jgi:hypothetical protein
MPGPAIHHIIAEILGEEIRNGRGLDLQDLFMDPQNAPYYFLGCQGPDFLFFNPADWARSSEVPFATEFAKACLEYSELLNKFEEGIKSAIPDEVWERLDIAAEAADEIIEGSVLGSQIHKDFTNISNTMSGLLSTLLEFSKGLLSSEVKVFDMINHPYRDGVAPNETWWMFDALHYRNTGTFVQTLLEKSREQENPQLHLYALGYLTHVAGDTVGHPYVNLMSGGPYRSHAQRHKVGENYQDVFNMFTYQFGRDFNTSSRPLHALYNFNYNGSIDTGGGGIFSSEVPDPNTHLPDDLAQFLSETINEVYRGYYEGGDPEWGEKVTPNIIKGTYSIWYQWFRSTTQTGTLPPPMPYFFSEEMRDIWEKFVGNMDTIGDFIEDSANSAGREGGILGVLLFLVGIAIAALTAAVAIADGIAGTLYAIPASVARAALAMIYEQIYDAYQNARLWVANYGIGFPMVEHLEDPILSQFKSTSDLNFRFFETTAIEEPSILDIQAFLPLRRQVPRDGDPPLPMDFHLFYPPVEAEDNHVKAAPESYYDEHAMHYVSGNIPFTDGLLSTLMNIADYDANNPEGVNGEEELNNLFSDESNLLGNAVDLTMKLYEESKKGKKIPNFNLDSDRGYGHLCWTQLSDSGDLDNPVYPRTLELYDDEPNMDNEPEVVNINFLSNE